MKFIQHPYTTHTHTHSFQHVHTYIHTSMRNFENYNTNLSIDIVFYGIWTQIADVSKENKKQSLSTLQRGRRREQRLSHKTIIQGNAIDLCRQCNHV